MLDINLSRNPLAEEVTIIFNSVTRDHYRDSITVEESRIKKMAMVKKNLDLHYVQELGDTLMEDCDELPWVVTLTMTDLPRTPKMDDNIIIADVKYTISLVKPANRGIDSIILLMVYPERSEPYID